MRGAYFSTDRRFRFKLWRIWDETKPSVMFIGLNPSTANEDRDDPTIRRVRAMARSWGYGGVFMMNLFPFVTPYPRELEANSSRCLLINEVHLRSIGRVCKEVIFAWGNFDIAATRVDRMVEMFPNAKALMLNKNGSPRHPLYVPTSVVPVPYKLIEP